MDAVNLAGKTPLHVACAWGQEQVVEAACMLGGVMLAELDIMWAKLYMQTNHICCEGTCGAGSVLQLHGASSKLYKSLRKALLQYSASIHAADQCQRLGRDSLSDLGKVFDLITQQCSKHYATEVSIGLTCQLNQSIVKYEDTEYTFHCAIEVETHLFMRPMRVEMCMQSFSWQLRRVQLFLVQSKALL